MIKKMFLFLLGFPLILMLLLTFGQTGSMTVKGLENHNLSPEVLRYKTTIERYAQEYDVLSYVPYLLAIMQVESNGQGVDPMQSSESIDGNIGNITNPDHSIQQGVKHFKNQLDKMKKVKTDIWSAVQAYNYGGGFLDSVKDQQWTFEKAEQFSKERANGERVDYVNTVSVSRGYRYRYNYGNMFYVDLVKQYIKASGNQSQLDVDFVLPINNPVITSGYGEVRDLILQDGSRLVDTHNGVDFVNDEAQPNIFAVGGGEIVFSGYNHGAGLAVVIKHSNDLYTYYFHLSTINVELGEFVTSGQVLGIMGSTGFSTGRHLHFGVSKKFWEEYIDPMSVLPSLEKE